MERDDAEEYTQALGQVVAGGWRQVALGMKLTVPSALGLSTEDWVEKRLGGYVRLSLAERKEAVKELIAPTDGGGLGLSQRKAAEVLGVDHETVRKDIRGEKSPPKEQDQISEDDGAGEKSPPKSTRELLAQSDQNDWRTPRKFLAAARRVLGVIDLDPASSPEANETVQATAFYTEKENGLTQPWRGRVWLNPPYGGQAREFIERLIREYEVGNVVGAIALVNSHPTETAWFQGLFRYTVCFVRGRIDFGGPSRPVASTSTHGSAIVYLGDDIDGFHRQFSKFGAVVHSL